MSLAAPGFVFRSCRRRYMPSSLGVRLFREPNAGDPPVRFDEREQETEPSQTGLRQLRESAVNRHRETKATAPVLDSTPPVRPFSGSMSDMEIYRQLANYERSS